jgi:hypothetical protein
LVKMVQRRVSAHTTQGEEPIATKDSTSASMTENGGAPAGRLVLRRETVRSLRVQSGVQAGDPHAKGGDPNSGRCPGNSLISENVHA